MDQLTLLITSAAASSSAIGGLVLARHHDQRRRDDDRAVYRLDFPPAVTPDQVTAFVRSLISLRSTTGPVLGRDSLAFEIVRRGAATEHWLRLPERFSSGVVALLAAALPGLRATRVDSPTRPDVDVVRELRLTAALPIRTDLATPYATSLLHAVTDPEAIATGDVVYQVVAFPMGLPTSLPTARPHRGGWLATVRQALAPQTKPDSRLILARREKLREPLFGVALRVGVRSTSPARSRQVAHRLLGLARQLDRPGVHFVLRPRPELGAASRLHRAATPLLAAPIVLNALELATLIAWPTGGDVPGLNRRGGRIFPPAPELATTGRVYGRATYPGLEQLVAVTPADARMHTLIIGPTGSGKSTTMTSLITQDLVAGRGVIVIDPNVALAEAVIARIPAHRTHDLIYLNPADEQSVPPLNPLDSAPEDAELVADQLLELIRDRSLSWGVTIDELLRNTLVLLAASPGMTLTEVPVVLRDSTFRARLLASLDPAFTSTVGEFFAAFAGRSLQQQSLEIAAVLNKVSPLIDRRPIRALLGQDQSTWTMRQVIDESKILVVALPSGIVSPLAADLIGSTVVRMVWNAVLGRTTLVQAELRPVSLYLDELPRFVGSGADLADILARARALGLDLVGALQHLAQVPSKLQAALLSEARNKVILQPAADDARLLARHLPGVEPEDLLHLPPRTALAALVAGGRVVRPVTLALVPPSPETGHGPAARIAAQRYGRSRVDVEQAIRQRREPGRGFGPRRTRRQP